jgi:hypothetical protein
MKGNVDKRGTPDRTENWHVVIIIIIIREEEAAEQEVK